MISARSNSSSALKAFLVLLNYHQYSIASGSSSSSSSSASSPPLSPPLIKPAAAVVTKTSALDTSTLMDVDREMLRMFGVSMEDGIVDDNGSASHLNEEITARRTIGSEREENQILSSSPTTTTAEKESQKRSENDVETSGGEEWWRDPFRLFESESTPPEEQGLEATLLEKKPKQTDLWVKKAKQSPSIVSSSDELRQTAEEKELPAHRARGGKEDNQGVTSITKDKLKVNIDVANGIDTLELQKVSSSALQPVSKEKLYLPTISPKTFTMPILIPLAMSKFKSAIPFTKYFLFIAMAQVAWSWVKDVPQIVHRWTSANTTTLKLPSSGKEDVETKDEGITADSSPEGLSVEEIESLQKLGFHQYPVDTNSNKEYQEREHVDDVVANGEVETEGTVETQKQGLFNRFVGRGRGRVSKNELKEELHKWKRRAQKAESEAESLQHEWSVCIQQLQEANAEKTRLQSTNKYLKEQLRDNQRTTDDVLKRERQKANDEIMRIREAMVEVLDRERKLIRDHMLTASKEVRAAILAAEDDKYIAL